jgi:hypothetical protein
MHRCDQCRFFHAYPPADSPNRISFSGDQIRGGGECRNNPPVFSDELNPIGTFPVVFSEYWCGRFEQTASQPAEQR